MSTQLTPLEQYVVNVLHEYDTKHEDWRDLSEDYYDDVAKHIAEDIKGLVEAAKEAKDYINGMYWGEKQEAKKKLTATLSEQLKKFEV